MDVFISNSSTLCELPWELLPTIQSKIDRESTYKASKAGGGESSSHTISLSICLT